MALFPSIKTLLTVDLDCDLGADYSAYGAAGALAVIGEHCAEITCSIQFIGLRYDFFGAEAYAKLASLAKLTVDDYVSPDGFSSSLFI